MSTGTYDIAIIGGGIAGASVGYRLVQEGFSVLLLESEDGPGQHTTGRSAAVYTQTYGNAVIRGLTVAGESFFSDPPLGFCDYPLLEPRGVLFVGTDEQSSDLEDALAEGQQFVPSVRKVSSENVRDIVPILRPSAVSGGAVFEPEACDIDVDVLFQGFRRGFEAQGGMLVCKAAVNALQHRGDHWDIGTGNGETYRAEIIVNAAGAWCDEVAVLAGAAPVGLVPKRRTVVLIEPPPEYSIAQWPVVIGVAEDFYFKPQSGLLLCSPADETPSPPCDAQPEELDIAITIDRIETVADLSVKRYVRTWAGLRSFVKDKTPVVGFDPKVPGFFWLAGQGGYGIQTAPALSRAAAALVAGQDLPSDIQDQGVSAEALSPNRF